MSTSLRHYGLQHARLPCPSPTPGACSNSCPSSWWCHPTISSSGIPFSSCPQTFPASGSFPMSQLCIRWPKYWSLSISPSNEAGKTSLELMRPRFVCPLASVLHSALWSRRNLGMMTSSVNGGWALTVLLRTHQDGSSAFSRERAGWERWTAPLLRHSEP